jgi:DNA invertase Pin-like site-specific DNA recombinase
MEEEMKNTKNTLKNVAIYIRVSTDKQAKKGDSLAEQEDTLRKYITEHDDMILYSVYIDDGISGQKLNRDEFTRLIDDVKTNQVDLIIFTKLDRWFRSLRHYLNTQATLEKYGVGWLAVSQPYYDTTTAQGRAFVAQSMTFAELEAQTDSERILQTFEYKVKVGEVISGNTPLGYKIVDKRLIPNDDAYKIVKIYEFYQKTPNLRALMRYSSDELGIVRGHKQFKLIMQNTKYKGAFRNNLNYCTPLVSKELWDECNRLLEKNQRSNKRHDYVFTGLLTCADCGMKMAACTVKHRKHMKQGDTIALDGTDSHYRYPAYRCQRRINNHSCDNKKQFYEKTLEKKLLAMFRPEIERYITSSEVYSAPNVDAKSKQKKIEKKIEKLKELFVNDLITLDEYKIDKAKYEDALLALPQTIKPSKDLTHVKNLLLLNIEDIYFTMNVNEKNQFWRSFLEEIRIDNNHNIELKIR